MQQEMTDPYTCGSFATEEESCERFDELFCNTLARYFSVFKEVKGSYVVNSHCLDKTGCRIDRILVPKQPLIDHGWNFGAIGVECKKSGIKAGRPLSQCVDYRDAAFKVGSAGMTVMLEQVFLWPFAPPGGAVQSLIAQRRVGGIYEYKELVVFSLFQQRVLKFTTQGNFVRLMADKMASNGKKRGSR